MKYYRDYWLISRRDALNCSAVCVNQDNSTHMVSSLSKFDPSVVFVLAMNHLGIHECVREFKPVQSSQKRPFPTHIGDFYSE